MFQYLPDEEAKIKYMGETQELGMKQNDDFIMLPRVDFCFKELMDDEMVRRGFLSALLEEPPERIEETELLPTILKKRHPDDKWSVLDVHVKMIDGTQIDLEIQLTNFKDWPERSLFYLCKMFHDQINEGDSYKKLKKCIHVGILDFNLFEGIEFYSRFHLWEDYRDIKYSDKLEVHILELKKVWNAEQPESELLNWARFFCSETKEDLATVAEKNSYINKACERVLNLSLDEQKKLEYDARMKALRDKQYFMEVTLEEGRQQGLQEGRQQGLQEGRQQGLQEGRQQGLQQGLQQGSDKKVLEQVCKKLRKGKRAESIAEELEESIEMVNRIVDAVKKYGPEYNEEVIFSELFRE